MEQKSLALGVCSSISIYKACDILRGFQKNDFRVFVIMTRNATRMISPLLFSSLSGQKVFVDPFDDSYTEKINHVDLAGKISLLLVAPATANMIGKMAGGIADDFLSTFYMAVRSPVLVAPAMNEAMYLHRQCQKNIQKLKASGVRFVEPEKGYLACEDEGWGRLASPDKIIEAGLQMLRTSRSLAGKKVLITAGPTREFLDPVRFVSNRSSGKMGFELAEEARKRGAQVVLVSGPTHLFPPPGLEFHKVESASQMSQAVHEHFQAADVVIMAAAVSDFMFARTNDQKVKKGESADKIQLVPTPDILGRLGLEKNKQFVVGFAAETEKVEKNALSKLKQKNLDMIVANDVSREDVGFESENNRVHLYFSDGRKVSTEKKSKLEISRIIWDEIEDVFGK
jgi:phosphopantothenoylcysteine decarboxylase/phosphopantothenate--cysteine ligase